MQSKVFLKCNIHSSVENEKILIKDIGEVYCRDEHILNKVNCFCIDRLKKAGDRRVFSSLYIRKKLEEHFPEIVVELSGEEDVVVEWIRRPKYEWFRTAFVCLLTFFGTAFSIMAFHNDIGIRGVFEEIYYISRGTSPDGVYVMEFFYCIGLFLGVTVFFNHFGKKKFTKDPTPVTVAMYKYEQDVDHTIIENTDRQGKECHV